MADFEEVCVRCPDGYEAYARMYEVSRPRAAVLYLPGIQSHCDWFTQSAARLCERGCAVLQVDRRGAGRNERGRGDADSAEQLIGDALAAGRHLRDQTGFERIHLVGVSWGGKLAVAVHVTQPEHTAGLTLVAPGLFPRMAVSREEQARIGFLMLYEPDTPVDIPLNDPNLLTGHPQWRQHIRNDPLTLRQCTARFFLASRRMDRIVSRLPQARPVPVHLMLAGDEQIVDRDATRTFIERLGWPHLRITEYPGARHMLEFEAPAPDFAQDLADFIIATTLLGVE